jgi:hypothetical protein
MHTHVPSCNTLIYVLVRLTVMTCHKHSTLLTVSVCRLCGQQWLLKPHADTSHYLLAHPLNGRVRLMSGIPYLRVTGISELCGVQTACVLQDTFVCFEMERALAILIAFSGFVVLSPSFCITAAGFMYHYLPIQYNRRNSFLDRNEVCQTSTRFNDRPVLTAESI